MKPCPRSCATRVSSFDVESIGDARGVHRIATAEDIEAAGNADEVPNDSYWVGFTIGSIIYTVDLHGPPDPCHRSKPWRSQLPTTTGLQATSGMGSNS